MTRIISSLGICLILCSERAWCGRILGYRVSWYEGGSYEQTEELVPEFTQGYSVVLELFGFFLDNTEVSITTENSSCQYSLTPVKKVKLLDSNTLQITLLAEGSGTGYFCTRDPADYQWRHEGTDLAVVLSFHQQFLSYWFFIALMIASVLLSALFNGLSIGMMSLDLTQLQVISNAGEEKERERARSVLPLRRRGHLLLCSILLASTVCNSAFTVSLEQNFIQGWLTVAISTLVIVIFCEIVPCAVVTKYALLVCAKTICLSKTVVILAFPLSYPLSKLLDVILTKEISVYSKDRIKELVKLTSSFNQMKKQEVDIISGALEMTTKKAGDAMTPLADVYMLSSNCYLDFITVADIMRSGYSRIPVFEGERSNIVGILYAKDLAILDPEDKLNIKTLINLFNFPCTYVQAETTLDSLFQIFKEGIRGHMAFVYSSERKGDDDKSTYEVTGVVTMEDVIEELIQAEIYDENDAPVCRTNVCLVDSRYTRKRDRRRLMATYIATFAEKLDKSNFLSEQLKTAAFQYLSNAVSAFKPDVITRKQLLWLLDQQVVFFQDRIPSGKAEPIFSNETFNQGLILILEGKVDVLVGEENLKFESGPFTYFGLPSLLSTEQQLAELSYSYRVEARSDVKYIKITRELYFTAQRQSQIELTSNDK